MTLYVKYAPYPIGYQCLYCYFHDKNCNQYYNIPIHNFISPTLNSKRYTKLQKPDEKTVLTRKTLQNSRQGSKDNYAHI